MNEMLADHNRLLALAIWGLFFSGMVLLKTPGHGVVYLGPKHVRLRLPSWRATFGQKLALALYPVHTFWPIADVQLLEASREGALSEMQAAAQQLARSMRLARPFLLAMTVLIVLVIPLWVIARGADLLFLGMAAFAYLLYGVTLGVFVTSGEQADQERARAHWKTLLEPLLCLPYGPHLCRKLSACYGLSVPLIDVLQSDMLLPQDDLRELQERLREHREVIEGESELSLLSQLDEQITRRLATSV